MHTTRRKRLRERPVAKKRRPDPTVDIGVGQPRRFVSLAMLVFGLFPFDSAVGVPAHLVRDLGRDDGPSTLSECPPNSFGWLR